MAKKEKVKSDVNDVHDALFIVQQYLECPKNQYSKFGNYSYRNAEDILDKVKPIIKDLKCIITCTDQILQVGDRFYTHSVITLRHNPSKTSISNCAQAREPESRKGMDTSQVTGATSSYARKYALNGMFAIDDNKDADFFDNKKPTPVKKTTDTPNKTWKPKGLPPTPLVESKIPEPNVEIMEQKNPPVFDFSKK